MLVKTKQDYAIGETAMRVGMIIENSEATDEKPNWMK